MKRLTHIDHIGWYIEDESIAYDGRRRGLDVDRLAAYEDTGLEPDEIDSVFIHDVIEENKRLKRLAQAEKDGRLVMLPCKVGDTVYVTYGEGYITCVVDRMHIIANNQVQVRIRNFIIETLWLSVSEFGETVFLTRQEAEAALKNREEADNEAD